MSDFCPYENRADLLCHLIKYIDEYLNERGGELADTSICILRDHIKELWEKDS